MIYCYTVTKDNKKFLIRKSKTPMGIRQMMYKDLHQKWLGDEISIEKHACDNPQIYEDVMINPKTGKMLIGTLIGRGWNMGRNCIYESDSSGKWYILHADGSISPY